MCEILMCGDNLMDKNLKKSKEVYGIIYLIRNKVNNKLYFGQTTKNFNIRYAGDIKIYKPGHRESVCS